MKVEMNEKQKQFIEMQKQFVLQNGYIDEICGKYIIENFQIDTDITMNEIREYKFKQFNAGPSLRLFIEFYEETKGKRSDRDELYEHTWIWKIPAETVIKGDALKYMCKTDLKKIN